MAEGLSSIEILPGEFHTFTETGLNTDAFNIWQSTSMGAEIGLFEELKPLRHYAEYFKDQDTAYQKGGKMGLFEAVMQRSNPETVAVFDQIVDEFNTDLPRIKAERDNNTVQTYFKKLQELRDGPPDQPTIS